MDADNLPAYETGRIQIVFGIEADGTPSVTTDFIGDVDMVSLLGGLDMARHELFEAMAGREYDD